MKKLFYLLLFVGLLLTSSLFAQIGVPHSLTVGEFFSNPLGMNLENMSFSWKLSEGRNVKQSAYQIQVAKCAKNFEESIVWDSGKVLSDRSVYVPYPNLIESRERLYWRVKVWDAESKESEWSPINFFEAGLKKNSDWSAKWIATSVPPERKILPIQRNSGKIEQREKNEVKPTYLRKQFNTSKEVKKARLYVASKGVFHAYINGKKVGDDYWGTGWTDYDIRIQSNTYDVTDMLDVGENALGVILADGWYSGRIGWTHPKGVYGDKPYVLMQLEIEYEDGSKHCVVTDKTWKCSFGAITYSDIYDGEIYDARLEMDSWNQTDFDDSAWKNAEEKPLLQKPLIEPRRSAPVRVMGTMTPISVNKIADGTFIYDFGQNMVGWACLNKIYVKKGQQIKVRFAEMLNKDGTLYTESYRDAKSTDYYIGKKYGRISWKPSFTFHGFRYVEISGLSEDTKPSLDYVSAEVLHSDLAQTGAFVCNLPLVNKLQSCIIWGQKGNFFSVPTDCPQRNERLGWLGDANAFITTAAFNMNVNAFFNKWLQDVRDAQSPEGVFPIFAPKLFPDSKTGTAYWGAAGVMCPWEIYMAYGDVNILSRNYEAMKKWIEVQKKDAKNFVRPNVGFGDWLQPNGKWPISDCPKSLIATAMFFHTSNLMSKIANVLDKKEDSSYYKELAENIRSAFIREFVKADGSVKSDCQTAYILPLMFDILPSDLAEKAFEKFVAVLKRDKMHLNTGFVGTPYLNLVLTKFGRMDLAYKLINNETYPSWLYPILQGGTTMWERWNSYSHKDGFGNASMNSFNHYAYGAIGTWLYKDVAGIWYDPQLPGYKRIVFAPNPGANMTSASATHETPYGTARSTWRTSNGVMEWTVQIPSNSEGYLLFPTKKAASIRIDGDKLPNGMLGESECGTPCVILPSGTYQILLKL